MVTGTRHPILSLHLPLAWGGAVAGPVEERGTGGEMGGGRVYIRPAHGRANPSRAMCVDGSDKVLVLPSGESRTRACFILLSLQVRGCDPLLL